MKIAFIAAGAAGMYCGSCLRDNAVAGALMGLGHDVLLVPLYTPLRVDGKDRSIGQVFYGGINVYLQQKSALFRKTPRWIDRLFDSRAVLALASKLSGMTQAQELGELALSTIRGEQGNQSKELDRLARWLGEEVKPRVVNLPNAMFAGAARAIKAATGAPALCSLTGEDLFLEGLAEPWRSRALAALRERAGDVDGYIAVSRYFADFMAGYLQVPREKIEVAPLGIDAARYGRRGPRPTDPFTIGFLARLAPEKGLHLLAEAFAILKKSPGGEAARLRAVGWVGPQHKAYVEEVRQRLRGEGLEGSAEILGEATFDEKLRFLDTLSVLAVPTVYQEPKGLFVLEALAHGTPVVLPAHGAFPELIEATGGGLLHEPLNPAALAERLREMMADREGADRMALRGQEMTRKRLTDVAMARRTLEIYEKFL